MNEGNDTFRMTCIIEDLFITIPQVELQKNIFSIWKRGLKNDDVEIRNNFQYKEILEIEQQLEKVEEIQEKKTDFFETFFMLCAFLL